MTSRHLLITLLFLAVTLSLTVVDRPRPAAATIAQDPEVPPKAMEALRQGRYLRASLILREYLKASADSTPETILLAAQAEAGWGDWERVESLLNGRGWLDSIASGKGWSLLGRSRSELGRYESADSALARYLSIADDAGDRERGLAELRRAGSLREAENYGPAIEAYDRAAGLLPQIGDWIRIHAAGAAASAGDTAIVSERLSHAAADVALDWGWRLRVRSRVNANDIPAALAAAESAAGALTTSHRRAEAWVDIGDLRLVGLDSAGARAAFLRAIDLAPRGAGIEAARKLSKFPGLGPHDRLVIGRTYLHAGNFTRGIDGILFYLKSGRSNDVERARLREELGRAYFQAGEYRNAEQLLSQVSKQSPSKRTAANALFLAGRAQYRDGRETTARRTFLAVADRFPGTDAAAEALYLSADLDHDDGRIDRAASRYRRTIRTPSDVDEVGLAYMRLADIAWVARDYAGALEEFEAYRTRYPNGRRYVQATYWAARSLEELGRDREAHERLTIVRAREPFSYYGGLAADRLGQSFWDVPLEPAPPADAAQDAAVARALARIDLLRAAEWDEAASYELGRVKRHFANQDGALYSLAEALNARGFTTSGITLGHEIHRREGGWNPRLLRIIYPFPYQNIIIAEARERDVNPFLAAALIRQESMFNADAVSGAGAIGLMQVMPATGRALAKKLGIRKFKPSLLKRAEVNVHLGMAHLADALKAYDGRLPVVLAAYNAGSTRVERWSEFPEFSSDQLFAERIPFDETRNYVKIVQQNARMYAALYASVAGEAGTGEE